MDPGDSEVILIFRHAVASSHWSLDLIPQNFRVIGQRLRQGVVKPLPWTAGALLVPQVL